MLIIGGGPAGLAAGCYARMNGWETLILEHAPRLGGLCTDWERGDYRVDGGIHWLLGTGEGGWFRAVFEELGIVPAVGLEPIHRLCRYEDPGRGVAVEVTRDLGALRRELGAISPRDRPALDALLDAAERLGEIRGPRRETDSKAESMRGRLAQLREALGADARLDGSVGDFCRRGGLGATLREILTALFPPELPALFVPLFLQQLAEGQLTHPVGGAAPLRDALSRRYLALGGEASLQATVEELIFDGDRAAGVRLAGGRKIAGDLVVSTASYPETALHLAGARYLDRGVCARLAAWPSPPPVLLLSVGVSTSLDEVPAALIVRQHRPLEVGGEARPNLYLRILRRGEAAAPPGHALIQGMVATDYEFWAGRGERYQAEKDAVTVALLERMEARIPAIRRKVKMTDLATPVSFWRWARSWRGISGGFLPAPEAFQVSATKTLPGLEGLYLAGQWADPGAGLPSAIASARELVESLCLREGRGFRALRPEPGVMTSPEAVRRGA